MATLRTARSLPHLSGMVTTPPFREDWTTRKMDPNREVGQLAPMISTNGSKLILLTSLTWWHELQHKEEMRITSGWRNTCYSSAMMEYISNIIGEKEKLHTWWVKFFQRNSHQHKHIIGTIKYLKRPLVRNFVKKTFSEELHFKLLHFFFHRKRWTFYVIANLNRQKQFYYGLLLTHDEATVVRQLDFFICNILPVICRNSPETQIRTLLLLIT